MLEFDADLSDLLRFQQHMGNAVRDAIEEEVAKCMEDGAERARNHKFKKPTGEYAKGIVPAVRGGFDFNGPGGREIEGSITATAEHSLYVEVDTKAHEITPLMRRSRGQAGARTKRGDRMLRFETAGGDIVFAKKVQHPGTTGQHVLEQCMTETEFTNRITAATDRAIDKFRSGQ